MSLEDKHSISLACDQCRTDVTGRTDQLHLGHAHDATEFSTARGTKETSRETAPVMASTFSEQRAFLRRNFDSLKIALASAREAHETMAELDKVRDVTE